MKRSARSIATILSVGMLFSMTACDKKAVENATETTEETTTEPTEETTEESIEESESEETAEDDYPYIEDPIRIDIGTLMGFENCYCEGGTSQSGISEWNFYTEDDKEFATQFGFVIDEPDYYTVDLDGDGTEELICPSVYTGDGANRVLIFRNNNGTAEEGWLKEREIGNRIGVDLCVMNHYTYYDEATKQLMFCYTIEDTVFPLTMDDFDFVKYGNYPEPDYPEDAEWDSWITEEVTPELPTPLGLDDWYCERTYNDYGFSYWDFYTKDGVRFAQQFGSACEYRPNVFIRDLDGDGINELISECYYHDSGDTHIFIYRNNNGTIEAGCIKPDLVASALDLDIEGFDDFGEYYERRKDKMVIISYETYGYYEITMDEFIFEDYSIFDPVKEFGS